MALNLSAQYKLFYPNAIFQDRNGVIPVKTATKIFAVGNNQTLVTAVSGKKIRVIGVQAYTTTGLFNFKDGSGGAGVMESLLTAVPFFFLPLSEFGYFQTSSNTALVCDVTVAAVNVTVQYIEI